MTSKQQDNKGGYFDEVSKVSPEQLDNIELPKESENIKFRSTPTGKNHFYEPVNKELEQKIDDILFEAIESAASYTQKVTADEADYIQSTTKQQLLTLISAHDKDIDRQARIDELKQLWNTTQPDIIPSGTPPLPIDGQIILDRIKESKENQDVSK